MPPMIRMGGMKWPWHWLLGDDGMTNGLRTLLHPHDPALLLSAIRENRRLHLPGGSAPYFQQLLSWDMLPALITEERITAATTRVVRQGRDIPVEMYMQRHPTLKRRVVDTRALQSLCDQGVSLVFNNIHRHFTRIAALNVMLERHLSANVQTNCYASFARQAAFKTHWDNHDVLILQIYGAKRWFCYGQLHRYPLAETHDLEHVPPGDPEWQTVMEPGDMLYLPRGDAHRAELLHDGGRSLHLTIGIKPAAGIDAVIWALRQALSQEEELRRDVSPLSDMDELGQQEAALRAVLLRLADRLDLSTFLAGGHWLQGSRLAPINLGLDDLSAPETVLMPVQRRGGTASGTAKMTADETAMLSLLLAEDMLSVGALQGRLAEWAPDRVGAAVRGLAGKSLIYVFAP